jgi:hypothetical protein
VPRGNIYAVKILEPSLFLVDAKQAKGVRAEFLLPYFIALYAGCAKLLRFFVNLLIFIVVPHFHQLHYAHNYQHNSCNLKDLINVCLAKIATFSYVLATCAATKKRLKFFGKVSMYISETLEKRFGNTHRLLFFLFCIKIARILEQDAGDFLLLSIYKPKRCKSRYLVFYSHLPGFGDSLLCIHFHVEF